MNKNLRQQLEKYFNELVEGHLADFFRVHTSSIYYGKGEFLYESRIGRRSKFILVEENPKGEASFRIQVGWSNFGRPPELPGRPLDFRLHTDDFLKLDEFFCNVFAIAGLKANFWKIDTVLEETQLVKGLWIFDKMGHWCEGPSPLEMLLQYGIPLLEKWEQS